MAYRILRLPEVEARTGLKRSTVYRIAADPESGFPAPIKLTERASGWIQHEIDAWIEERANARQTASPEKEA